MDNHGGVCIDVDSEVTNSCMVSALTCDQCSIYTWCDDCGGP